MSRSRRPAASPALILAAAALLLPAAQVWAAAGEVTHLSGAVVARKPDGQSRILSVKSEVAEGDVVATAENSYARVKFSDGTEAVLRPATQVKIDVFKYEEQRPQQDNIAISLLKGGMRAVTGLLARRNPASFRIATPSATIGIRGTSFGLQYCNNDCGGLKTVQGAPPANGLHADVSDGSIVVTNQGGSLVVSIGQFAYVQTPATPPVPVPANQALPPALLPQALTSQLPGGTVGVSGTLECAF